MTIMSKISVIIPTFGFPVYLEKCINSVLSQSFRNFELIIVDDNNPGTKDRQLTESIVKKAKDNDPRIIYIKHDKNKNGAVARNTGISIATGQYISFLDSDDFYKPDRLAICHDALEHANTEYAGVYTGCEFRRKNKEYNSFNDVKSGNHLIDTLACNFMICTGSNLFIRRNVIEELNGFDENFHRHQDYEFLVRLFTKYKLLAIPKILVIKNNENFNLPNIKKQIAIKKQYIEKYEHIINMLPPKDVNYIMHGNYINIAENAVSQLSLSTCFTYYRKAYKHGGLSFKEYIRMVILPIYNLIR